MLQQLNILSHKQTKYGRKLTHSSYITYASCSCDVAVAVTWQAKQPNITYCSACLSDVRHILGPKM